ncbi:MAG: hypothetical protein OK454_01520 [Thaumarchaeota archaeon]|nr:hypothetical protein [Nitrososphaerota archaeon]MDA4137052.1 hypothetical protein [Nitrososphaerota archaeon]
MESSLSWIHTAPQSVRLAFMQGFFESAGVIDANAGLLLAPVLPWLVDDILRVLNGLNIEPAIIDVDPPTLALDLRVIKRIPLLSPVIKDGKYYKVRSALSRG